MTAARTEPVERRVWTPAELEDKWHKLDKHEDGRFYEVVDADPLFATLIEELGFTETRERSVSRENEKLAAQVNAAVAFGPRIGDDADDDDPDTGMVEAVNARKAVQAEVDAYKDQLDAQYDAAVAELEEYREKTIGYGEHVVENARAFAAQILQGAIDDLPVPETMEDMRHLVDVVIALYERTRGTLSETATEAMAEENRLLSAVSRAS